MSVNKKLVLPDETWTLIKCPVCKFEYNHILGSREDEGADIVGSAWSGRGKAVRINMECENSHKWVLVIGFHKGSVFLTSEV